MITTDAALLAGIHANPEFTMITSADHLAEALGIDPAESALDYWTNYTPMTEEEIAEQEATREAERITRAAAKAADEAAACPRCEWRGRIAAYFYIEAGTCFACCGTGRH